MTNINKLRAKIIENGYNLETFSNELNISKSTLSIKINNKSQFTQKEIGQIIEILKISDDEIKTIFFE